MLFPKATIHTCQTADGQAADQLTQRGICSLAGQLGGKAGLPYISI